MMKHLLFRLAAVLLACSCARGESARRARSYAVADTGQDRCYGDRDEIAFPQRGEAFFGQDAQYVCNAPRYRDNGDGTVSDLVTGLMWEKTPDFVRRTQDGAERHAARLVLAGHDDWRVPTIKELFSIADFRGNMHTRTPYVDTTVFDFKYPGASGRDGRPGTRDMDAQYCSSTRYLGITMGRDRSAFGFNFADGRVKSYPLHAKRYVRCIRGNPAYGKNRFRDHGDGTVTDDASGLIWQKADSGRPMNWREALAYAEKLELAGHDDWRLPNVKELQSIVDYNRAPDATDPARRGAAIDHIFRLSARESWFWSSTTHIENLGGYYVCFGQAFSARWRDGRQLNAHGAGAVRSDPKEGDPARWPDGLGPQNDEIRIANYVRCVRGGDVRHERRGPLPRSAGGPGESSAPRSRFIQRLDRNGDGKVSKGEFDGPGRHFDRLDADGDGLLDADEAPGGDRRGEGARRRGRLSTGGRPPVAGPQSKPLLGVVTAGTGGPLFNPDRSRPCTMITYGESVILVDTGEGTANRLRQHGVSLRRVAAVCFTHHHRDHNADAVSILPQIWQQGRNVPIIGPRGTRDLVSFIRTFYDADMVYRTRKTGRAVPSLERIAVVELPGAAPSFLEGLAVTTAEVPHTITTFAYRFDAGGRSVVVSGDLSYSAALIRLARDADILVMDSGAIIYEGESKGARAPSDRRAQAGPAADRAHASMEDVARMAAEAGARKLVLTHFRPGTVDTERTLKAMRSIYAGEVVFARDMQAFE